MAIKLLIAEDEDIIRNSMEKYIRLHTDRFSQIYTAKNGAEALELIFLHRPDILLLDVQMPVKSGLEVMQELKRVGVWAETIILSGFEEFSYAQQALRYGARDYLLKPVRSSDILKQLLCLADQIEGVCQAVPDGKEPISTNIVDKAKEYIQEHYVEELTLKKVADIVGISAGYLSTQFSQCMGYGFADYLNQIRVDHACVYLKQNYFKTYEIAYKVGYRDEKYFARVFKKVKGMSPSEYKNHPVD